MISAGAEVIWSRFYDVLQYGDSMGEEVAVEVFQAMARCQANKAA